MPGKQNWLKIMWAKIDASNAIIYSEKKNSLPYLHISTFLIQGGKEIQVQATNCSAYVANIFLPVYLKILVKKFMKILPSLAKQHSVNGQVKVLNSTLYLICGSRLVKEYIKPNLVQIYNVIGKNEQRLSYSYRRVDWTQSNNESNRAITLV